MRKLFLGMSGVLFVLFLIFHLIVNLTSVISRGVYETAWLNIKGIPFIQIIIPVFIAGIVLHILLAGMFCFRRWTTVSRDRKAEGYEKEKGNVLKTALSLSGIIIGLSVIHIEQFWIKVQLLDESPYDIATTLFYNGFYVAVYALWIIALYYYLSSGFWGLYRPAPTGRPEQSPWQTVSMVLALLIAAGFIFIPVYFYLGFGYL